MSSEDKDYKFSYYQVRSNNRYDLTKYKIVMNWLPNQPNLRVLNAGCGSGDMNLLLCQNSSWHVDAIDVDEEAIRLSQELKVEHNLRNLQLFHTSIEEHAPQEEYDIIISIDVLEHIEDDWTAIKTLQKMLKPNGIICISVPAIPWLYGYHDSMLGHYRRYQRRNLTDKLSFFFNVKKCRYFGASLIPIVLLYSCWLRKSYPIQKIGKHSLIKSTLDSILAVESKTPLPIGISLMALATPKDS
jgi:2-polyprenyl-3-methyl-5-hydroxy-6-metoxy-1,4-benzoquinol methylase